MPRERTLSMFWKFVTFGMTVVLVWLKIVFLTSS